MQGSTGEVVRAAARAMLDAADVGDAGGWQRARGELLFHALEPIGRAMARVLGDAGETAEALAVELLQARLAGGDPTPFLSQLADHPNPGAFLRSVAHNFAVDHARRQPEVYVHERVAELPAVAQGQPGQALEDDETAAAAHGLLDRLSHRDRLLVMVTQGELPLRSADVAELAAKTGRTPAELLADYAARQGRLEALLGPKRDRLLRAQQRLAANQRKQWWLERRWGELRDGPLTRGAVADLERARMDASRQRLERLSVDAHRDAWRWVMDRLDALARQVAEASAALNGLRLSKGAVHWPEVAEFMGEVSTADDAATVRKAADRIRVAHRRALKRLQGMALEAER